MVTWAKKEPVAKLWQLRLRRCHYKDASEGGMMQHLIRRHAPLVQNQPFSGGVGHVEEGHIADWHGDAATVLRVPDKVPTARPVVLANFFQTDMSHGLRLGRAVHDIPGRGSFREARSETLPEQCS